MSHLLRVFMIFFLLKFYMLSINNNQMHVNNIFDLYIFLMYIFIIDTDIYITNNIQITDFFNVIFK